MKQPQKNVLGTELSACCHDPLTGYHRDGFCRADDADVGAHLICVRVTEEFLRYSKEAGNDLSTPRPEFGFPGLEPGDCWCVCASRWVESWKDGVAPPVLLESTHERALEHVSLDVLRDNACGRSGKQDWQNLH